MTQRALWRGAAVLAVVGLVGCGSSGDGGETDSSGFPESTPAAEDEGGLKLLEWGR